MTRNPPESTPAGTTRTTPAGRTSVARASATGTRAFSPASRGGERRVRAAVGLARRLADVGLRYRFRELQLLVVPCAVALLPLWAPPRDASIRLSVLSPVLCLVFLAANAALSLVLPWADQHVLPLLAMLAALAWAVSSSGHGSVAAALGFPGTAALIALAAALVVRAIRLTTVRAATTGRVSRPLRPPSRRPNPWPLHAATAVLAIAAGLLTAAALRSALG